jgi:drug/metabolite transporter (DMT)-like permease
MESTPAISSISAEIPTATRRHTRLITVLGFAAMVLIWGSFPVVTRIGVEHAPPLLFSSIRFLSAFCIMAAIVLVQRKRLSISRKQHLQIALISLLLVGIPSSIFFSAVLYAPVGVLTLMWATTPIFTALFTLRSGGEVRGWRLLGSLVIGSFGILIVFLGRVPFWPGTSDNVFAFASSGVAEIAELAVLGSSVVYGLGMFMTKRSNPDIPLTVFTAWQVFYSGAFIGLMGLIFERGASFQPSWTALGALAYLTVFCGCISFFLTFWLIRRIGAIRTAYGDFVIPGVTLILSYFFLGESLTMAKIGGLALVILGIVLVGIK